MNTNSKRKIIICVLLTVLLFIVFIFSNAIYMIGGASIKDDNRLLYMYRSEYQENGQNKAVLINSHADLRKYYDENKERYNFDTVNEKATYYELKSFRDFIFDGYYDAWFTENSLILLITYETSDEYYYRLNSLDYWFTKAQVCLYRDKPNENAKGEKVCWHTFLEVEKKSFVYSATVEVVDK